MLPKALERGIAELRSDNRSGALEIARRAAELLPAAAEAEPFAETLEQACRELVRAQPSMAPLVNLANRALWESVSSGSLRRVCENFAAGLSAAGSRIAEHTLPLIEDGGVILTYSASGTVRDSLLAAHSAGRRFRVLCTESRPVGEGVELARRLGEAGLEVTLALDAALLDLTRRADIVIVGADAISSRGVVNKVGTSLLAMAARYLSRQMYVLSGTQKILPAGYEAPAGTARPTAEIVSEPMRNVAVENHYFDVTPLGWAAGVVTEEGQLPVWKVREAQQRYELHAALKHIGSGT